MLTSDLQPVGIGLYLGASVIDHSCVPNAAVIFHGKDIVVRAIKPGINDFREDIGGGPDMK